jgi:hypothetical protein
VLRVSRWKCLVAVFGDAVQHRWWGLSILTASLAYGLTELVPAFHGWPRTVTSGGWLVIIVVLYAGVIISYRRRRRAARRDMYARIGTAQASYEATKRPDQN